MAISPLALPPELADVRRQRIARHGALAIDLIVANRLCPKCDQPAGFSIATNLECRFDSVAAFLELASRLAADTAKAAAPATCRSCGSVNVARVVTVQYHAYHSGLGQDLVAVWQRKPGLFSRATIDLFIWDAAGGMRPAGALSPEAEARFAHDSRFRAALVCFEAGDASNGVGFVEELCEAYPRDPLLLRFAPILIDRGYARISQWIADNHREIAPDDAEGHFWSGEVLFRSINHRVEPLERLPEARAALEAALARAPDLVPAALSLANVLRAEGRDAEARAAFERLLARQPDCAEAHYNFGLALLDAEPARALACFETGERLAPADADYPVGAARALLGLGRKADARAALARAKARAPAHPRFAELDAALA